MAKKLITKDIEKEISKNSNYEYSKGQWHYVGPITKKDMHWLAYHAYKIWESQGERCEDKNHKSYPDYGKIGVKRIWSGKDCIDLYLKEFFKRESWTTPTISRNEDKGNYTTDNVKLIEFSENSEEARAAVKKAMRSIKAGI